MTIGKGIEGGLTSEINMTPMIDVLLVLLIIFMVTAPVIRATTAWASSRCTAPRNLSLETIERAR